MKTTRVVTSIHVSRVNMHLAQSQRLACQSKCPKNVAKLRYKSICEKEMGGIRPQVAGGDDNGDNKESSES